MSCGIRTAMLEILQGDGANFPCIIGLRSNKVSIGRAQTCGIILGSSEISREHATLEYVTLKWFIRDTSSNGLWVNGSKLVKGELFELKEGDEISFLPTGALRYRFRAMPAIFSSSSTISTQPSASRTATPSLSGPTTLANRIVDSLESSSSSSSSPFHNDNNKPSDAEYNNNSTHRGSLLSLGNGKHVSYSCSEPEPPSSTAQSEDESPIFSSSKRNHASDSSDRDDQKIMVVSEDQINKCDNLKRLKLQLKSCQAKLGSKEAELKNLKIQRHMERQDFLRKENELQSVNAAFKEDTDKKILELLESELSCGVCKQVFIQATVVDCGHTFCSFCINGCARSGQQCPICRKTFRTRSPHIEMENYISRLFDSFTSSSSSSEVAARRNASIRDREEEAQAAAAAAEEAGGDAAPENQNRSGGNLYSQLQLLHMFESRVATIRNLMARVATENQNPNGGNIQVYLHDLQMSEERYLGLIAQQEQLIRNVVRANEILDRLRGAGIGIQERVVDGTVGGQAQPAGRGGNNRNATGNEANNNGTGPAAVAPPPIPPTDQPTGD